MNRPRLGSNALARKVTAIGSARWGIPNRWRVHAFNEGAIGNNRRAAI
jgi:hypothetical protein